jgi:hypothetical protein
MNMTDTAEKFRSEVQRYRDNGWQVTRLRPGGKMAYEKDWPNLIREADDFEPGENIGVRFGPQSGGLVDVDLDYATARRLVGHPAFGLNHLVEFGRASLPAGQRGHRLVIVPDAPNRSRVLGLRSKRAVELLKPRGLKLTVVELRGSNGSQTAFPPSIIRSEGKPDDRLVWSGPDTSIPTMSWVELNQRAGRLAFCALATALYPADHRDAFCASIFGALIESAVDIDVADKMVAEVSRVAGDEAVRDTALDHGGEGLAEFLALTGLEDIGHIVRSWLGLQTAEPDTATPERERLDHDIVQGDVRPGVIGADTLRRLLDPLDPEGFADYESHREMLHAAHHATGGGKAARQVFVEWCSRSEAYGPGKRDEHGKLWSDVVKAMWDRTPLERDGPMNTIGTIFGHLLDAGHGRLVTQVGREIESAGNEFSNDDLDAEYLAEPEKPEPIDWDAMFRESFVAIGHINVADIPPTPWQIEGLTLYGEATTIGGLGGAGKSTLMWMIVCSVATGKPLAWWPAPDRPRKVIVLSGEDSIDEIERRVSAACQAMGIERSDLGENFMVWSNRSIRLAAMDEKTGKVSYSKLWGLIRWAIKNQDVGLLAIDPLIKVSSGFRESDNDDMEALYAILRAGLGTDCAALTSDHFAKSGSGGDQGSIRGASAKVDAARAALTVSGMTEEEFKRLRPPRPRYSYVLVTDPKQNYAAKRGARWLEFIDFEVGNGETRPALVWRDFDSMEFYDPAYWDMRDEFLRVVAEGYVKDGQERRPWGASLTGPKETRLDVAVSERLGIDGNQATAWIKAFASEGSIMQVDWKNPNRTVSKGWEVNPDFRTDEDEITEDVRPVHGS